MSEELMVGPERRKENVMIPYSMLGLIATIIFQTMGAIWWASGVSVKLDYLHRTQIDLTEIVSEGNKNKYSSIDAAKDWDSNNARIEKLENELYSLKEKVVTFQAEVKSKILEKNEKR